MSQDRDGRQEATAQPSTPLTEGRNSYNHYSHQNHQKGQEMAQKRTYKNPYHQTQSELAEWLSLFAHDYSTTEVADALVERYLDRTTGDPKADHRLAKEAICTVNPNDSRYNAKKWDKQFRLTQANYLRELDHSHRQLASKAVSALNTAYDNL